MIINAKRLIKLARKWHTMEVTGRRRTSSIRTGSEQHSNRATRIVADKGHFVVYTAENRRFMVPLACLNNCVFKELLHVSEEEFGLSKNGPITLPCDTTFLKSVVSLVKNRASEDLEKYLLFSITAGRCSSSASFQLGQSNQHLLVNDY